ncbi:hypothetical protein [Hymenobacter psychrophilus]|uniref:Uncharacterized protein n=1 Tax=Hymenobacter psychrophilus TaxID=651662 RepID=A0A1H3GR77_9BACT|nr:hypothetical protein [Hymenobacter psychrophilus]SDY05138.1 hypothetical protein SAMN04488069_105114 [Hymenobacter psychrophilus]
MKRYTVRQKEFLSNLEKATGELIAAEENDLSPMFQIVLMEESGRSKSSIDDVMEYGIFRNNNFSEKTMTKYEVVELLTAPNDKFPLWIKIRLDVRGIIELTVSKRFRTFRELHNRETGHPPFVLWA